MTIPFRTIICNFSFVVFAKKKFNLLFLKIIEMNDENALKISVFLSQSSVDVESLKTDLETVMSRAGLEVVSSQLVGDSDFRQYENNTDALLENSSCSVHILGGQYEKSLSGLPVSVSEIDFQKALQQKDKTEDFHIFVWFPAETSRKEIDPEQANFIKKIRNSILPNMIFSNHESPVAFVEDLRSIMQVDKRHTEDVHQTDVFFIYHELDEHAAEEILRISKDVMEIKGLKITNEINAENYIIEQLQQSKLAVVYFEQMLNWAKNFVPQVWKRYGGASATTPILMIADESIRANHAQLFEAPNVIPLVLVHEIIPLEIKVRLDQLGNLLAS